MATIDEIKQQAAAVKNATQVGENTALRVGGVLVDLCEWVKNLSGTSGGSGVSLGTLLAQLNTENPFPTGNGQVLTYNGSNFIWKTPTGSGGSSSSSSYPLTIYNGSSNADYITYDGSSSAYLKFKSGFSISKVGLGYEISVSGGGSGVTLSNVMSAMNDQLGKTSYGTPQFLYWDGSTYTWKNESEISGGGSGSRIKKIKLFNTHSDYSFETIDLGTADTIGFMAGDNITLEAIVKEYTNVIKISAKGGNGGSGGSTSTSVSWSDVTNKPSTFTPSSHTHSTSDIEGLSNYLQNTKVDSATNADKAKQLTNPRLIWGQSFNGTGDINGNLKMGSAGGGSIQLWMNGGNMLDRTDNTLHIGYGLKESSDGEINLDANVTKIYTDNYSKHYDFKSNVFDVNSNQIHFGSETNGGRISWDAANNAFKIEGNVYATGGITALGVSNNATTSNNVDFTFRSVSINGTHQNKVQLTDEGLLFYNQNNINAYYKKDSIGLYDSANDACCKIFGFTDSEFVFDPDRYSIVIRFNTAIECSTDENTLIVGNNSNNGYIVFSAGSTMTFNHNNKNYSFNVDKAIEQGILTI